MKTLLETSDRPAAGESRRDFPRPTAAFDFNDGHQTLIDQLLAEQRTLTAVEKFSRNHKSDRITPRQQLYRDLIPVRAPQTGEQYAFTVDLDKCSGCKACVSACHSLNGLDETEVWRSVGLLTSKSRSAAVSVPRPAAAASNSPFCSNSDPSLLDESLTPSSKCGSASSTRNFTPAIQQHITTACHHCVEPACLEGCPVLAYDKDPTTGIVRHLDDQCIGCNYCVMKCPYEVPKYSSRLGIVRKCDMCANRLSVGEAPACAQACPTEAIRITLVNPLDLKSQFRRVPEPGSPANSFLPDSPDPRITLPTTRYISKRGLPADLLAADARQPRLDEAHWPLTAMLLLTQTSTGMFLAATVAIFAGLGAQMNPLLLAAFATFIGGLAASALHLGQPLRAWRCFLGWRKSWLSREIILFNAMLAVAAPVAAIALTRQFHLAWLPMLARAPQSVFGLLSTVPAYIGLVAVFASAMVYVDTYRPCWCVRLAFGNFFGTVFLLGAAFSAVVLAICGAPAVAVKTATLIALAAGAALFFWRWSEYHAALGNPKSPIHFNACVIQELLPWTTRTLAILFFAATACGILAIGNVFHSSTVWIIVAALAACASEIIARYLFFAAGAGKRMPGGIFA